MAALLIVFVVAFAVVFYAWMDRVLNTPKDWHRHSYGTPWDWYWCDGTSPACETKVRL